MFDTHRTAGEDVRPLHGDRDAVEEDDDQNNMVKHLVGDDLITQDPKPAKRYTGICNLSDTGNGHVMCNWDKQFYQNLCVDNKKNPFDQ